MRVQVRAAVETDVPELLGLQQAAPESAQWSVGALLNALGGCSVAEVDGVTVGFLLWRSLPDDDYEILNLAVDPRQRRQGVAGQLLGEFLSDVTGTVHLEVRESNEAARALYRRWGFSEEGVRRGYYHRPVEDAVVMRRSASPKPESKNVD